MSGDKQEKKIMAPKNTKEKDGGQIFDVKSLSDANLVTKFFEASYELGKLEMFFAAGWTSTLKETTIKEQFELGKLTQRELLIRLRRNNPKKRLPPMFPWDKFLKAALNELKKRQERKNN